MLGGGGNIRGCQQKTTCIDVTIMPPCSCLQMLPSNNKYRANGASKTTNEECIIQRRRTVSKQVKHVYIVIFMYFGVMY